MKHRHIAFQGFRSNIPLLFKLNQFAAKVCERVIQTGNHLSLQQNIRIETWNLKDNMCFDVVGHLNGKTKI